MAEKVQTVNSVQKRIEKLSSRLVSAQRDKAFSDEKKKPLNPDKGLLEFISRSKHEQMMNAEVILQMTPDTQRAMAILTGLIVCPNGGSKVKLNYSFGENVSDVDDNERAVLDVIREYFTNDLNLEATQYDKVERIISKQGAEIYGIIPDSVLDSIINNHDNSHPIGLESLVSNHVLMSKDVSDGFHFTPGGFLGTSNKEEIGLENAFKVSPPTNRKALDKINFTFKDKEKLKGGLIITDNADILKIPALVEYNNNVKTDIALEKYQKNKKYKLHQNYYTKRDYKINKLIAVPNQETFNAVGRPQLIYFSPEAVCPVFYPGEPERRFGYFVLLDQYGAPLHKPTELSAYRDLLTLSDGDSQLLSKIGNSKVSTSVLNQNSQHNDTESLMRNFNQYMRNELITRLANGTYHTTFELGDDDIFYRVMMSRSLSEQQTQILFLPEQMVSYQAFEYNQYGVGVSLVEKSQFWATIRSVLTMAHYLNELSNCVNEKKIKIKGDPNDPRPTKTIEKFVSEYIQKLNGGVNYGYSGPADIIDSLQRFNAQVEWEGFDEGGIPDIKFDVEDIKRQLQPVSQDMLDFSRKMQMQHYFLAPSTIDDSFQPEFAASIARENELTARMLSKFVTALSECNKDFIQKYTAFDEVLIQKCMDAITIQGKKKKGEEVEVIDGITLNDKKIEIIQSVLNKFTVSTPIPDQNTLETSKESLDNMMQVLEVVVDAVLSDDINQTLREVGENLPIIKSSVKSYVINNYLQQQTGIPAYLSKLTTTSGLEEILNEVGDENVNKLKLLASESLKLAKADYKYGKKRDKQQEEIDRKLEEENNPPDETSDGDDTTPPDDGDTSDTPNDDGSTEETTDENPDGGLQDDSTGADDLGL